MTFGRADSGLNPGPRPKSALVSLGVLSLAVVLSVLVLRWDFAWLTDPTTRSESWERFTTFVGSMTRPDLSGEYLRQCLTWVRETVTTALAGTVLGILLGWTLALCASRAVVMDGRPRPRSVWGRIVQGLLRVFVEVARLALDVLRGVPDFVWAVIFVAFFGLNRIVGTIAIGLSVAGILGKIYSELWDAVPAKRLEPLRTLGGNRAVTVFYGIHPLTARSMVSFTLMRAECAIRNASVLGVVVGGGLGGALMDELGNDAYPRVGTLVLTIISVTVIADLISNAIRYQIRNDPNHPRTNRANPRRQMIGTWFGVLLALAIAGWAIGDHLVPRVMSSSDMIISGDYRPPAKSDVGRAIGDIENLSRSGLWDGIVEWAAYMRDKLLVPNLSPEMLGAAAKSTLTPLGVAVIGTLLGMVLAAWWSWLASVAYRVEPARFTGERSRRAGVLFPVRVMRLLLFGLGKAFATISRSIPEVLWALILIRLFGFGAVAGIAALALHSAGVLARVYTETIDNIPYRRLEQTYLGRSSTSFVGIAMPVAWRDWLTYSFFQFESNVRMGVVLGLVGIGGLGSDFKLAYDIFDAGRASTLLITMVLLTTIIDRTSRSLNISRGRVV